MAHFWLVVGFNLWICCISSGYATVETCRFESKGELGLHPKSFDDGARSVHLTDISDSNGCQLACCGKGDCQLAILGTPADGPAECILVSCVKDGKDVCALRPSSQFKVFRKMVTPAAEPAEGTARLDTCRSPQLVGPCKAALTRFYYDISTQSCKSFIYGGCHGNSNNFGSQEECESTCSGVTDMEAPSPVSPQKKASDDFDERCHPAPEIGPCRASLRHYFYNSSAGSCQTFVYGGCRGNNNNYATEEMCRATCISKTVPKPKKPDVIPAGPADFCLMPSDSGRCRAAFSMFYYDSSTRSCQQFIYGGCGGNANRFASEEECTKTCPAQEGHVNERGSTRDRWTPAFFLVATVAVISALVLAALISISVRKFRLTHHSPLDDKEDLLGEEELPSYMDTA